MIIKGPAEQTQTVLEILEWAGSYPAVDIHTDR